MTLVLRNDSELNDDWIRILHRHRSTAKKKAILRAKDKALSKQEHLEQLEQEPKIVDVPEDTEGSDAWFHFDSLYEN